MEREKIIFLRNVFLRAFAVGILFALFYWIATVALWHTYAPWLPGQLKMDEKGLGADPELFCERADSDRLFLSCPGAGFALELEEDLTRVGLFTAHYPNES
jgi:hypothetical protein